MNKLFLRPLQAATLAVGGPVGWLAIQLLEGKSIIGELEQNWGLYVYMLFGTLTVFILFGSYVGKKEQYIIELSVRDPLTGIYNLRFFLERLEQEVSRSKRYQAPMSLIYFDLDHFKKINDEYGHPSGDKVLVEVTKGVLNTIRKHDIFARVGGEEFAVLLPRCDLENAVNNAERIRQLIESMEIKTQDDQLIKVTTSAGVTTLANEESGKALYKHADEKLYEAKHQGRNRVVF